MIQRRRVKDRNKIKLRYGDMSFELFWDAQRKLLMGRDFEIEKENHEESDLDSINSFEVWKDSTKEILEAPFQATRILHFHSLEHPFLRNPSTPSQLHFRCPLCDIRVRRPSVWTNLLQHYTTFHWEPQTRVGEYTCFPCRQLHSEVASHGMIAEDFDSRTNRMSEYLVNARRKRSRKESKKTSQKCSRQKLIDFPYHYHCPYCMTDEKKTKVFETYNLLLEHAATAHNIQQGPDLGSPVRNHAARLIDMTTEISLPLNELGEEHFVPREVLESPNAKANVRFNKIIRQVTFDKELSLREKLGSCVGPPSSEEDDLPLELPEKPVLQMSNFLPNVSFSGGEVTTMNSCEDDDFSDFLSEYISTASGENLDEERNNQKEEVMLPPSKTVNGFTYLSPNYGFSEFLPIEYEEDGDYEPDSKALTSSEESESDGKNGENNFEEFLNTNKTLLDPKLDKNKSKSDNSSNKDSNNNFPFLWVISSPRSKQLPPTFPKSSDPKLAQQISGTESKVSKQVDEDKNKDSNYSLKETVPRNQYTSLSDPTIKITTHTQTPLFNGFHYQKANLCPSSVQLHFSFEPVSQNPPEEIFETRKLILEEQEATVDFGDTSLVRSRPHSVLGEFSGIREQSLISKDHVLVPSIPFSSDPGLQKFINRPLYQNPFLSFASAEKHRPTKINDIVGKSAAASLPQPSPVTEKTPKPRPEITRTPVDLQRAKPAPSPNILRKEKSIALESITPPSSIARCSPRIPPQRQFNDESGHQSSEYQRSREPAESFGTPQFPVLISARSHSMPPIQKRNLTRTTATSKPLAAKEKRVEKNSKRPTTPRNAAVLTPKSTPTREDIPKHTRTASGQATFRQTAPRVTGGEKTINCQRAIQRRRIGVPGNSGFFVLDSTHHSAAPRAPVPRNLSHVPKIFQQTIPHLPQLNRRNPLV
eukprot:GHVP01028921.1.p1 GENE.GHVP01028921.1~~GHVP01028921.1.p1  ORF type:complete len:930 (+),score=173.68 GHVP01028921.1:3421-6210(+)